MTREVLGKMAVAILSTISLALWLFSESPALRNESLMGFVYRETSSICHDSSTQWMIFLGAIVFFIVFILLRFGQNARLFFESSNASLWLISALLVATFAYVFKYQESAQSTQALVLLATAAVGQGAVSFSEWWAKGNDSSKVHLIISIFALLLLSASLWWGFCIELAFQYLGQVRWSGPWDNPNLYGLLMGVGIALIIGQHSKNLKCKFHKSEGRSWKLRIRKFAVIFLFLFAIGLMAHGLLRSYSRGAWLATACGLTYLVWQQIYSTVRQTSKAGIGRKEPIILIGLNISRLRENWLPFFVIVLSTIVIAFWHFRQTEWHPARRAFSAINTVDFSWRNRIAAWQGALQITAEHPWFGAGWNKPEPLYQNYYLSSKINESAAIRTNDYLMLGATLGIPVLFCFEIYLWLALTTKLAISNRQSKISETDWLKTTCRAGSIVLIVGFWFDGGLFKLPTAMTFWILLELGSAFQERVATQTDEFL
jgi:hypothetical protein